MKPSDGPTDPMGGQKTEPVDEQPPQAFAPPGYRIGEVLGRGGMGEVVIADDLRIGRQVAIKRMRGEAKSSESIARFLREAKIQARLDHPAIVPVHALGRDDDGRPFFTMKRLAGTTLEDVLRGASPNTNELLRAFVDVCHALDFAHARGIVHRDLKPANVMLGDYGEVYVLDWGVARVLAERDWPSGDSLLPDDVGNTRVGTILGTPAYMAPEQRRGEPVGPAADVYALGGILFEILAGEPLHALTAPETPPAIAMRRAERAIAPELDSICARALAVDPAQRPTARQLADAIRSYLDGDRDLARRQALAAEQLARARAAIATGNPGRRAEAMSCAGRALALDPSSRDAATLVTQLMLEPPRELPPGLAERLEANDLDRIERQGRLATVTLLAYLGLAPGLIAIGIRDWSVMAALWSIQIVTVLGSLAMTRRMIRGVGWAVFANTAVLVLASRVIGPFVVVPGLITNAAVSMIAVPSLIGRPWLVLGAMVAAFLAPFGFEYAGLWPATCWWSGGDLVSHPTAVAFDGATGTLFLAVGSVMTIVATALFVRSIAVAQRRAQRQLEIQAWHLGQLLPVATR
jgi:eukaryotic-like serine/threonine-protein kinase